MLPFCNPFKVKPENGFISKLYNNRKKAKVSLDNPRKENHLKM